MKFIIDFIKKKYHTNKLVGAITNNNVDQARYHLQNGANSNVAIPNKQSSSALNYACRLNNFELVKLLVEHHAAIEGSHLHKCTPLMEAAEIGNLKIVKYLLAKGAKVNSISFWKDTPLISAIVKGHREIVRCLIIAGADTCLKGGERYFLMLRTPLAAAIQMGHQDIANDIRFARKLIEKSPLEKASVSCLTLQKLIPALKLSTLPQDISAIIYDLTFPELSKESQYELTRKKFIGKILSQEPIQHTDNLYLLYANKVNANSVVEEQPTKTMSPTLR